MKPFFVIAILFCILNSSFVQATERKSIIHSIDDYDFPYDYVEVSDEALPSEFNQQLKRMSFFRFTPITEARSNQIFERLKKDPRARMRSPGGFCSRRRIYIQNVLRGMNILSGKLFINCPANRGRLRFQDQVSKRYFSYSNFHDTNVVLVKTATGNFYRIWDLQFQNRPMTLNAYLAKLEAFQDIRPAIRKDLQAGICFWSITSQ